MDHLYDFLFIFLKIRKSSVDDLIDDPIIETINSRRKTFMNTESYQNYQNKKLQKQKQQEFEFKPEIYNRTASSYMGKRYIPNKTQVQQVEEENNAMLHSNVSNKVDNEERYYNNNQQQNLQINNNRQQNYNLNYTQKPNSKPFQNKSVYLNTPSSLYRQQQVQQYKMIQKPLTLALDIDLTLIYSTMGIDQFYDHQFTIRSGNYTATYSFNQRPGLKQFLTEMKKYYNLIIFTSAGQIYADKIIEYIDPKNEFFQKRFYQQDCVPASFLGQRILVKDLRAINTNTKNIILIDDNVFACKNQPLNLIQCQPFKGNKDDNELEKLSRRLIKIYNTWIERSSQDPGLGVNRLISRIF